MSSVFVGDLHLRPQTWNNRPDITDDAYTSFNYIIDFCAARKCSLVLMGDIFNTQHPDARSVSVLTQGLETMAAAQLPVFVIQGQHDRATPPWPQAVGGGLCTYVHQKIFQPFGPQGLKLYGIDQQNSRDKVKLEIDKIPADVQGVCMHQLFREVFPLENAWDTDGAWLPVHIKHGFIGDYHQPVDFGLPSGGRAYYSGSTYMCKLDEPKEKSFLLVHPQAQGGLSVERQPLPTRACVQLTINEEADIDKAVAIVQSTATDFVLAPLYLCDYRADVRNVEHRLRTEALDGRRGHLWLRPRTVRLAADGQTVDFGGTKVTMESCIDKYLPSGSEAYALTMDLLKQPADQVLLQWRERLGVRI